MTIEDVQRQIDAHQNCPHTTTRLCRKETANKSLMIKRQCMVCGKTIGNSVPHKSLSPSELVDLPWFDPNIEDRSHERFLALLEQRAQLNRASFWGDYSAYLKSDAWKTRRQLVMNRAQGRCEGCGEAAATQVHHLTYDRVMDEMLFDLVAICKPCHEKLHPRSNEEREWIEEQIKKAVERRRREQ